MPTYIPINSLLSVPKENFTDPAFVEEFKKLLTATDLDPELDELTNSTQTAATDFYYTYQNARFLQSLGQIDPAQKAYFKNLADSMEKIGIYI